MTILVLSLVVPVVTGSNVSAVLSLDLGLLIPTVITYVITFVILGVIWIGHHNMFSHIERVDRTLLWLNILLLLSVGFTPFSTALIGRYPLQQITVVIYGINALIISFLFNVLWLYASSRHLLHKEKDPKFLTKTVTINSVGPLLYLAAIFVSFVSIYVSIAIFGLVPLLYIAFGKRYLH